MEELLNYLKEFLFKIFKNKWMALTTYIIILLTISLKNFFLEGLNTLSSNNILSFYNLPEEIVEIKYIEFWQLLFAVLLILGMILHPKIFLKENLILKIIFEILFSISNAITILVITLTFLRNNNILVDFILTHPKIIFMILIFLFFFAVLEVKDLKEVCYQLKIYYLKFKRKKKEIKFNKSIWTFIIVLYYTILIVIFLSLLFYNNICIFISILLIFILSIIFKYTLKIFLLFKSIGINIMLFIPLYSFFYITNKGPEDKRRYLYLEKEKGIIEVVVYEKEGEYIIQNARIIKTYGNKKILILDTRNFYAINREGIYNKEVKVENFDNIEKGIVMNNEEARIKLEL